jgi:hypothetical protein
MAKDPLNRKERVAVGKGETMRQQFRNPPNEFRPLQIIHGFDYLGHSEYTIRQGIGALKELGIGGLVVNVSFKDYMRSKEQWEIFQTGLRIAERLGLRLWLYDEDGYPSGAAGGLVLERNPEWEAIGLIRKVDQDGNARYEVERMYEGTHCTDNFYGKRRYPNLLDRDAVRAFITVTHQVYAKRIPKIGKRIYGFFTDEPSLVTTYVHPNSEMPPALPWVEDLPKEFKRRMGYELEPYLESLFSNVDDYQSIRCDFYEVIAQLIAERYFGQIKGWCRRHRIASSGHLLAEESLVWHAMYYGNLFACLKYMDIPGIDMITSGPAAIVSGNRFIVPKFISSAAHLMGCYETMSETSDFEQHIAKKQASLIEIKATASIQYLLGINTINSYYGHAWRTEGDKADYAHYNDYVGRLSVMLRNARHVCDVAVLYPIAGIWANFYPTSISMYQPHPNRRLAEMDEGFIHLCRFLLQNQIDFDVVDESAIQRAKVQKGLFHIAKERYRVLIVPSTDAIHFATLQRIGEMVGKDITVVAISKSPKFPAGRNEDKEKVRIMSDLVFSGHRSLPHADANLIQTIRPAISNWIFAEPSNPDLWIAHYIRGRKHIYFAVNVSAQPIECTLRLPTHQSITLWKPDIGEIEEVRIRSVKRGTALPIELFGFEGLFLVSE